MVLEFQEFMYMILLGLVSTFTGMGLKYIRNMLFCVRRHGDRIEMLEYIAIKEHPDLVDDFKRYKEVSRNKT